MRSKLILNKQQGFTLIEILAVLVLLGVLAAVAVPKYISLTDEAKNKAVAAGITALNARETQAWGKAKLSGSGWVNDTAIFVTINTDLGTDYSWSVTPTVTGGELQFQTGTGVGLTRTASSSSSPGNWKRT